MLEYLVAAAAAVILSDLAFDPGRTEYWRRWLGRRGYWRRRVPLGLASAVAGAAAAGFISTDASIVTQFFRGLLAGAAAAGLMRYSPGRAVPHFGGGARTGDSARVASVLAWAHDRMCGRMDDAAERRIHSELGRQKVAEHDCRALLASAEEIAVKLDQEADGGKTQQQRTAQQRLTRLRTAMDQAVDPGARSAQRQTARYEVAEILAQEFIQRRWSREAPRTPQREAQ